MSLATAGIGDRTWDRLGGGSGSVIGEIGRTRCGEGGDLRRDLSYGRLLTVGVYSLSESLCRSLSVGVSLSESLCRSILFSLLDFLAWRRHPATPKPN